MEQTRHRNGRDGKNVPKGDIQAMGTSNTIVVGGSNQTNVVDLGQNNNLTWVNVGPGLNLGELVSAAMQEKCALIATVT